MPAAPGATSYFAPHHARESQVAFDLTIFRPAASLLVAAASLLGLAGWLLWLNPRSRLHRALALYLLVHAMVLGLVGFVSGAFYGRELHWTRVYFQIAAPFAALNFALVLYQRYRPSAERAGDTWFRATQGMLLVVVVAFELAYFLNHSLYYGPGVQGIPEAGPFVHVFALAPGANVVVSAAFAYGYAHASPGPARRAFLLGAIAFLFEPLYQSSYTLASQTAEFFAKGRDLGFLLDSPGQPVLSLLYATNVAGGLVLVLYLGHSALQRRRMARAPAEARLLLFELAPLCTGIPVGAYQGAFPPENFYGVDVLLYYGFLAIWALAAAVLVAYGLVEYRFFDIDIRIKTVLRRSVLAAVAGSVFFVTFLLVDAFAPVPFAWAAGLTVMGSLGFATPPLRRFAARVTGALMPHVEASPDYVAIRKLEVYRAALEEAQSRPGTPAMEDPLLSDLRRRLGVSLEEHRILLLLASTEQRVSGHPSATRESRFRIERELGRGAHGSALLAYDTILERRVALKQPIVPWLLTPEGRKQFLLEARLAARISHPNVVAVYEVMPQEDPPLLVLEYVEGGSLDQRLRQQGRLPGGEAISLMQDVLSGLEQIHKAGIVHRDLKPANILLTAEGVAKVTDLGIAQPPAHVQAAATLPLPGFQPGTLAYMSPEQARGAPIDARSDLYSCGAILYRALTGRPHLEVRGDSANDWREALQRGEVRLPAADVPSSIDGVLSKALARDPKRRYQSAAQMRRALEPTRRRARALSDASGSMRSESVAA